MVSSATNKAVARTIHAMPPSVLPRTLARKLWFRKDACRKAEPAVSSQLPDSELGQLSMHSLALSTKSGGTTPSFRADASPGSSASNNSGASDCNGYDLAQVGINIIFSDRPVVQRVLEVRTVTSCNTFNSSSRTARCDLRMKAEEYGATIRAALLCVRGCRYSR